MTLGLFGCIVVIVLSWALSWCGLLGFMFAVLWGLRGVFCVFEFWVWEKTALFVCYLIVFRSGLAFIACCSFFVCNVRFLTSLTVFAE